MLPVSSVVLVRTSKEFLDHIVLNVVKLEGGPSTGGGVGLVVSLEVATVLSFGIRSLSDLLSVAFRVIFLDLLVGVPESDFTFVIDDVLPDRLKVCVLFTSDGVVFVAFSEGRCETEHQGDEQ